MVPKLALSAGPATSLGMTGPGKSAGHGNESRQWITFETDAKGHLQTVSWIDLYQGRHLTSGVLIHLKRIAIEVSGIIRGRKVDGMRHAPIGRLSITDRTATCQ